MLRTSSAGSSFFTEPMLRIDLYTPTDEYPTSPHAPIFSQLGRFHMYPKITDRQRV